MIPPELTVTPEDQQNISAINNVTYNIKGFGNEDLKSFKLYTTPYFYKFDTTFGTFVHSLNFEITLQLPEILQDLPDDSIITVTFELADSYDKTTVIRTLKVIMVIRQFLKVAESSYISGILLFSSLLRMKCR